MWAGADVALWPYLLDTETRNRALNACCLALAWSQRGDLSNAREWVARARGEDPACTLLPRAPAALESAPVAVVA